MSYKSVTPSAGEGCAIATGGCALIIGYYAAVVTVVITVSVLVLRGLGVM